MTTRLYPAIDLLAGQAVRLRQGDYDAKTVYGDPVALALGYRQAGATHLHMVDLDAARTGARSPQTRDIVASIVAATGLMVQIGGGIRNQEDVEYWLALGVWRCVLGTVAAHDPRLAGVLRAAFGERVAVGIDARGGRVATQGWTRTEGRLAVELAQELCAHGYTECVYTDIARDGMLSGANIESAVALSRASGLSVIVSGGVKDLEDVRRVRERAADGLSGVILGRSLLEGTLDLREAARCAQEGAE